MPARASLQAIPTTARQPCAWWRPISAKAIPSERGEVTEFARRQLPDNAEFAARLSGLSTSSLGPKGADGAAQMPPRLYLGAGTKRLAGYIHVDVQAGDGIDQVWDLNATPWPWGDDAVETVVAEDLVEHLDMGLVRFCDEAWRVLRPGGELFIRTPHHEGKSSWIDPTHRWHLGEEAFHYLDPATEWGRLYAHYTPRKWRLVHLAVRGPQNIHAILIPRKSL